MRTVRFYCESIEPQSTLDPVESRHLSRVLKLSVGAPVELFDGRGTLGKGIVSQINSKKAIIRITDKTRVPVSDSGKLILAVSFAKGQRFDWLIEKCTELGADHIAAVRFERTVKLGTPAAMQRLHKITIAAAKQCRRLFLPQLSGPANLTETISRLRADYPESTLIYGSPDGKPFSEILHPHLNGNMIVFIGPEGGLTDTETDHLNALKALPVSVNKNILRVETAAVAFCSLLRQQ